MKKTIILLCGFIITGCMLASDGEPGRSCYHTEADQRRRSLNAEFARKRAEAREVAARIAQAEAEKAKAEAREAAARACAAKDEAQRIQAAKNPKGLVIKIPRNDDALTQSSAMFPSSSFGVWM